MSLLDSDNNSLLEILRDLSEKDLINLSKTNKRFNALLKDREFLNNLLLMRNPGINKYLDTDTTILELRDLFYAEKLYRNTINKSSQYPRYSSSISRQDFDFVVKSLFTTAVTYYVEGDKDYPLVYAHNAGTTTIISRADSLQELGLKVIYINDTDPTFVEKVKKILTRSLIFYEADLNKMDYRQIDSIERAFEDAILKSVTIISDNCLTIEFNS